MHSDGNLVREVQGFVSEISSPFKATVTFGRNCKTEKAILRKEKFIFNGRFLQASDEMNLDSVLKEGDRVQFTAHGFNPLLPPLWADDGHSFYIISCWSLEDEKSTTIKHLAGLVNVPVKVGKLCSKRQGVFHYEGDDGKTPQNIHFLASKVFLYGSRLKSKQPIESQLSLDDELYCDAIPCDSMQNEFGCQWFATAAWRGSKPSDMDTKVVVNSTTSLLNYTRALSNTAKTVFIKGRGEIMGFINDEFGLALLQIRPNMCGSVLFHRSVCFLAGLSLSTVKLPNALKEGDPVRLICVSTQDKQPFKFVACQLVVDFEGPALPQPQEWPPFPHSLLGDLVPKNKDDDGASLPEASDDVECA